MCLMLHPDGNLFVDDMQVPPLAAIIWGELRARLPDQLGVRRKRPVVRSAALPTDAELFALDDQIEQLIAEVPCSDAGWLLECPRSSAWWHYVTTSEGSTPIVRHQRGASSSWSSQTDKSIYEHSVLSEVSEKALCIDQLDVTKLCSLELCVRRLQLIAEAHRVNFTQPNYQGSEYWMSARSRKGGILVTPHLSRFVAEEQRQGNAIPREKRKAAENGASGAKTPPPKK